MNPDDLTSEQTHRKYLDELLEEMLRNGTPITKEESARIDAEIPPFVPQTDPRRMALKIPISELLKARAEVVAMTEQIENSDTPGLVCSPVLIHPFCEVAMIDPQSDPPFHPPLERPRSRISIDEALVICRGTMTKEESDRLDAETPPFVAETRNGYMTYREDDIGPRREEPSF